MAKKRDRIHRQLEAYAFLCERCAVCHWPKYQKAFGRDIQLHHVVGRRGGLDAHDHRNLLAVCGRCHEDYHQGHSQRPLTLGHLLTAKLEEDGEELFDLAFLAKLLHRTGLKEDPKPLPQWVHEERARNDRTLKARAPFIERE
jgi:hypothetical protein